MQVGYTGKLPAYGDFVQGGGSLQACKNWSAWAEKGLIKVKEISGFHDLFLTSPIWRFVVTCDVFASAPVAGVFCPSMDKVGRLFPFAVLTELPIGAAPLPACTALGPWFETLENAVLSALDPTATTEQLSRNIHDPDELAQSAMPPSLAPTSNFIEVPVTDTGELAPTNSDPLDLTDEEPEASDGIWITLGGVNTEPEGLSQRGAATSLLFSRLITGEASHEF